MAGNINYRHKRTSTANKRPLTSDLQEGELVLNNEAAAPGVFLKTNTNTLVKIGPASISASPPTLEGTGTTSYSKGELWFDTANGVLKVHDGTSFINSFNGVLINVQDDPPASPSEGDLWYDDDNADLYMYVAQDTNAWVNVGPGGGAGAVATLDTDAPSGPVNGQLWWDTDDNLLFVYNAGTVTWDQVNSGVVTTVEAPFGVGWNGDTSNAATRNALYDLFTGDTAAITPDWDFGSGTDLDLASSAVDFNTGSILGVNSGASLTAANATAVTVPTRSVVAVAGEHTDNAASQAWVYDNGDYGTVNGRLTLVSGTPVLQNGSNTSSTIYFTPYLGNKLWLYNTVDTRWDLYHFSEISLALSGLTSDIPHEVFVYDNAGTLTLETVAWTNYNTRSAALAWQNGIPVKAGELNKRYLGLIVPESNVVSVELGEFTENSVERDIGLRNYYNPITATLIRRATTNGGPPSGISFINTVHDYLFDSYSLKFIASGSVGGATNYSITLESDAWGNTTPATTLATFNDRSGAAGSKPGILMYDEHRYGAYIYAESDSSWNYNTGSNNNGFSLKITY